MDIYEVEINGSSIFSLKVRPGLPISSVTHLAISTGVLIRAIHKPVENMPRNLRLSLGGGVKVGDMFFIRGKPTEEAKGFVVNWQSGPGKFDDVLFQLNPRLDEGRIVRNCRLDDEWGKEENSSEMPFAPETSFQLAVGVTSLGFETRLDGKEWISFRHRNDVGNALTLFMEGDLQPSIICIDSAQMNLPALVKGIDGKKSRGVRLQLVCPEIPITSRVTGGFEKGCVLLISGKTSTQPSSLQLNVQCGEGEEECDIALRYNVLWESDGSPKVTINSREDNTWGKEMHSKDLEGFLAGRPFDLIVSRMEDGFRCFLDGVEHAHFPYRLEDQLPDHVTLSGDLEMHRLMAL